MKKVKVKTKQKQKQSQTVNINLGNVLKKSKPRRKTQPKQQPNISQPITFNAPPIREYVDTSLYNIPSKSENPLLARSTINPIPDIPININPTSNTVGSIQNDNPLFKAQPKPERITDEPIHDKPPFLEELSQYIPQFNLNKKNKQPNDYEIELQQKLIEIQKQNSIKKKEEAALLLKEENKKKRKEKALQKKLQKEKDALSQTDIQNYATKPSVSIKKDIQTYSVKPEETQPIFSAHEQPITIFAAPQEQESITSLPIFYQMQQTESNLPTEQYVPNMSQEEENAFNRAVTKAPTKKRPPSEEGKKIVTRPIKTDPLTGEPIKKPKKTKLDTNIIDPNKGKNFIIEPAV